MTGVRTTSGPHLGDWSTFEELELVRAGQLSRAFEAAATSPFYLTRDGGAPSSLGDLLGLPFTTKSDLRAAYPFGFLAVDRTDVATYHESSGSSGQPTSSYYTPSDWDDLIERYARKWPGIGPADTLLVKTPYALMLTGHVAHAAAVTRGAMVVPADNRSLAMPYSRVIRLLHDLDVTLSWSLPTDTLIWAAAAAHAGLPPAEAFPALRALFVAGEPLSPARRHRIAEIWGAPVVNDYGATEVGPLAGECRYGRLHLWADRAIFEVHDPSTGATSRVGRGQLVVTPLYREAMPLLRYNIEDDVEIAYEDCPCGWVLPTLRVFGRSRSGAGAEMTSVEIEDVVFRLPAELGVMFWRARLEREVLEVQIEVADRVAAEAIRRLCTGLHDIFEHALRVHAVSPGTLMPVSVLTAGPDVLKPRGLFRPGEDWNAALRYF